MKKLIIEGIGLLAVVVLSICIIASFKDIEVEGIFNQFILFFPTTLVFIGVLVWGATYFSRLFDYFD